LNALLYVSYMYMLAKGNTKFTLYQNIITILFFVPALLLLADAKGAFGASLAWAGMNLAYLLISLPLFHRYFMKGEMLKWYVHDIGRPLLTAALILGGARALQYYFIPGISLFGLIGWVALAFLIYGLLIPDVRKMAKQYLSGHPVTIK
jgi:O-antigen/teichoic acid export membrane protein